MEHFFLASAYIHDSFAILNLFLKSHGIFIPLNIIAGLNIITGLGAAFLLLFNLVCFYSVIKIAKNQKWLVRSGLKWPENFRVPLLAVPIFLTSWFFNISQKNPSIIPLIITNSFSPLFCVSSMAYIHYKLENIRFRKTFLFFLYCIILFPFWIPFSQFIFAILGLCLTIFKSISDAKNRKKAVQNIEKENMEKSAITEALNI